MADHIKCLVLKFIHPRNRKRNRKKREIRRCCKVMAAFNTKYNKKKIKSALLCKNCRPVSGFITNLFYNCVENPKGRVLMR